MSKPFLKWAGGKYTQLADLLVHMPGTTGFTAYAAGGFSWENQVDLAKQCVSAFHRGARVVISNSSAPKVLDLYREHGFNLQFINARRSISCKSSTREVAKDVVAIL